MENTQLYILKFGGTSVGKLEGLLNIKKIVLSNSTIKNLDPTIPKIIIVSAATNSTNILEKIYNTILDKDELKFNELLKEYVQHETNLNKQLNINNNEVNKCLESLKNLYYEFKDENLKLKDLILSYGEIISMHRLYELLCRKNSENQVYKKIKKCYSWDLGFITDSNFGNARLLNNSFKLIKNKYDQLEKEEMPDIIITTGFIGKNDKNEITTLGRGGSDLSATLFAKALNPICVQIWSDVPGIMTSDPRYIKNTQLINNISYNEALELSFYGAKILHPETLEPILEYSIPLHILNTFDLNCDGTIIDNKQNSKETSTKTMKGISYNDENSIIYIEPKNSFISNNFVCNIFLILNSIDIKCSMISFSKTSLSICIKTELKSDKLLNRLLFNNSNKVTSKDNIGVICVVGESLCETQGIASKIFSIVSDCKTNIEMISQSVSQTNILFAIKQENIIDVVQQIHDKF